MFTGIIEGVGWVQKITFSKGVGRLRVIAPFSLSSTRKGDSMAVNGCCLTLVSKSKTSFEADLSDETLRVTAFDQLKPGDLVNLERPLRLSDRLGGHLVQGHVDSIGHISRIGPISFEIVFPQRLRRYLIPKGSVAVDGISMTVNHLTAKSFTLVVIPHTLKSTNLKAKRVGDPVHLEVDMVGKYVENLRK